MRSVAGVVVGLAIAAALMIGSNIELVKVMASSSGLFLAVTLLGAVVYHLLAGFACGAVARDAAAATGALVVLGTALLLSSVLQTWSQMPPWYSLAMLVIAPVCLWQGAGMHRRRRSRPQAATAR